MDAYRAGRLTFCLVAVIAVIWLLVWLFRRGRRG
jgi:hypothetical protein